MPGKKLDKRRIISVALIGSTIATLVITGFDYFLLDKFSWMRIGFYFVAGLFLYGFLAYRNFNKQNK